MGDACPAPSVLEQLVLGHVTGTEADTLEGHLATCRRCPQVLQELSGEDDLVRAMRPPFVCESLPRHDLAVRLGPLLRRLTASPVTGDWDSATYASGSVAPQANLSITQVSEPGGATTDDTVRPSEHLGVYRIVTLLGSGGMGSVWLAEDTLLKRQVALKVIRPSLVSRPEVRERFLVEAQALAQLEHDHIVTVYQIAEENGVPYLAMQLLVGETLHERLKRAGGPLDLDELLRIGRETASGLAVAHERGLVHRDIKPANLWLDANAGGRVKILDFGLVRALADDTEQEPGRVLGTPAYMAPEQAACLPVDGRADLFALGCVLYQAATGRMPFQGSTLLAMLLAVTTEEPPAPRSLNPKLPVALERLVIRLLAKKPDDRPASADEVVAELAAIERSRRPSYTRRWVLGATAALVGGTALGAWYAWLPPEPVEVTFDYPEADGRLVLQRTNAAAIALDVKLTPTLKVPPGDYALSVPGDNKEIRLVPARLVVEVGKPTTCAVRLVGELDRHRHHAGWPVEALVVRATPAGAVVVSGSQDRSLVGWQPQTGQRPQVVLERDSPFRCLALTSDGRTLATGSGTVGPRAEQLIRLWDADKLTPRGAEWTCKQPITAVAFSPDGKWLLSGENDGTLSLWDVRAGAVEWFENRAHGGQSCTAVLFLPDGKTWLSAGGDGLLVLRDFEGAVVQRFTGHEKAVRGVVALPDKEGHLVSASLDGTLRRWLPGTDTVLVRQTAAPVQALALSPNGRRLLTGHSDGTLRLWDTDLNEEPEQFTMPGVGVTCVAWLPDGRRAVSGGADGVVRLWQLPD